MGIEGQNARTESPREVYDRAQKWVEEQQFGTPEYQAISDCLDLETLKTILGIHLERSISAKDNETIARSASSVRIAEGQI